MELKQLASNPLYENPKLAKLEHTLLEQFKDRSSRGIIFSKTRRGTHCLHEWVSCNPELQRANICAGILTGAGVGANHMTQVVSDTLYAIKYSWKMFFAYTMMINFFVCVCFLH